MRVRSLGLSKKCSMLSIMETFTCMQNHCSYSTNDEHGIEIEKRFETTPGRVGLGSIAKKC